MICSSTALQPLSLIGTVSPPVRLERERMLFWGSFGGAAIKQLHADTDLDSAASHHWAEAQIPELYLRIGAVVACAAGT